MLLGLLILASPAVVSAGQADKPGPIADLPAYLATDDAWQALATPRERLEHLAALLKERRISHAQRDEAAMEQARAILAAEAGDDPATNLAVVAGLIKSHLIAPSAFHDEAELWARGYVARLPGDASPWDRMLALHKLATSLPQAFEGVRRVARAG